MDYIPWHVMLVRFIVPFSILRFPLLGILASIEVDGLDWNIIGVASSEIYTVYQYWDKIMDSYSFLFIVWVVLQWQDVWARKVALGLFGYRIIGVGLFLITGWRPILFFFPNAFENFVILCLVIFWLSKKKKLNFDPLHKAVMLGVLIIPKMIHEYFQHFLGRQPWEIYSFGSWLGFQGMTLKLADPLLWCGLLYVLPMVGFFTVYQRKKQSNGLVEL